MRVGEHTGEMSAIRTSQNRSARSTGKPRSGNSSRFSRMKLKWSFAWTWVYTGALMLATHFLTQLYRIFATGNVKGGLSGTSI